MYVQCITECIANVLQTYYTSYMKQIKISKTFRLSQEAVDVLEKQDNATQFLEELITGRFIRPLAVVPLNQVKEEIKLLLEDMGTPTPKNPKIASPAANLENLKKQTGMITAEELNYEPIE